MAVRQALAESQMTYGSDRIFLERAILPANFVDVQLIGDGHGTLLHLGVRDGSIQFDNQKLLAESPAPCLSAEQEAQVCQMALTIARLFDYQNAGTVEFLMGADGTFYFAEIKARIQVEHPVTEMVTGVDIVREQIEIAAGKRITTTQEQVKLTGWAMQCRLNARNPWNNYLPSPGHLRRFRLPGGPNVRVDTYAYSGCEVPVRYDPMLAKVAVWGEDRDECVMRMRRALQDFAIGGIQTDLSLFQRILEQPGFIAGRYNTQFLRHEMLSLAEDAPEELLRDLAAAVAIAYLVRYQSFRPVIPDRLRDGWHRSSRQIPG
jgi:acetyl/propionyl-CoA carboxylase alpha subunit